MDLVERGWEQCANGGLRRGGWGLTRLGFGGGRRVQHDEDPETAHLQNRVEKAGGGGGSKPSRKRREAARMGQICVELSTVFVDASPKWRWI
eukprot:236222-Rhodomonas_salina.4